ncbi:MAG: HAMP domain-containing sensor histidine kinase [Pyrinomonadaceae bacterium]
MSKNTKERLKLLRSAADEFGERNFSARVKIAAEDELGELEASFNKMAERLQKRAVRFQEADKLKSDFVSSVSHELRTPLTTIKALTRLLMRGEITNEKRREYLETISVECDRQIDLVLNLLDLSRIEGGVFRINYESVSVLEAIESCVRSELMAAGKRHHKLSVEAAKEVPPICADPKALRRVVSNLIENSIKYTPDGGLITLSAALDPEDENFVLVSVSDNGRGIPTEDLPVLFNKFHRGKPVRANSTTNEDFLEDADVSGVGLGLYLGKNVIEQMGGKITVETEVGHGSTFYLHLPVWKESDCGKQVIGEQ